MRIAALAGFVLAGVFVSCTTFEPPSKSEDKSGLTEQNAVETWLQSMTVRQKIAQMMFVWASGEFHNESHPRFVRLKNLIETEQIGGIVFSSGDVYGQAMMVNKLQALSPVPLWVTQDMEYGAAMRVRGTTWLTPAMGVAATGNEHFEYQRGYITAREARALGVHQIFAPVVDVNNNPDNPIINVRSYSEDPETVARFAVAFIRGAHDGGVVVTPKHFPGHGDTHTDSHASLPVIYQSYARLDSLELVPFRAAIRAGAGSIMTAHIAFTGLSADTLQPGTLNPAIVSGLLRDSLGFTGLIATDALQMKAISANYDPGEAAIRAILAGADMLLIPHNIPVAIDQTEKAVQHGLISEERLNHSVRSILAMKVAHGLLDQQPIDPHMLSALIHTPAYQTTARDIAQQSITVLKNEAGILPVTPGNSKKIAIIALADDAGGSTGTVFLNRMRSVHNSVSYLLVDRRTSASETDQFFDSLHTADRIIIASYMHVRVAQGIELPARFQDIIDRTRSYAIPTVLVSFGNPYILRSAPETEAHVLAWANHANQMVAAADAINGSAPVNGTLPVTLPGLYPIGHGLNLPKTTLGRVPPWSAGMHPDTLNQIEHILYDAVNQEVFPGAVVMVVRDGNIVYENAVGYHDYKKKREMQVSDMFDLASITKVMGTTLAAMKLVDEGSLSLDQTVKTFLKAFDTPEKETVSIRHLLMHTSGLPAFKIYVDELNTRQALIEAILNEPLKSVPGERYEYSDLGMITLALVIEHITGRQLDAYLLETFYEPLGMHHTRFNPLHFNPDLIHRIPPTEYDTLYRKQRIHGWVHDERAWYMDGVAGHAGLFSTASDMAVFADLMHNLGTYGGKRYLSEETVRSFVHRSDSLQRRGLGFDMKNLLGFTTAGSKAGYGTFGHTGFTGTSIWIDPDNKTTLILLTNRTYPYRRAAAEVSRVRAQLADMMYQSIIQ